MTHPLGCRCMTCALTRLRLLLHSEIPSKINQHAVPILRDREGLVERKYPDVGGVGMSMTAAMHRYLGGPDDWGLSRLGMLSILEVSDWCASVHPPHRRPMFTRTLCGELAFEASYLGQELDDLEWKYHGQLSRDQITGMLAAALNHAEQWRKDRFARWTKVPGEDSPLPERRPIRPAA